MNQIAAQRLVLRREQMRRSASSNLLDMALMTRPNYMPNWHHRHLCSRLDAFSRKETRRLMVFMPPRHGKSELGSRCLPAYLLGRDPDTSIIAASYSADLASQMNRDVQRIIDSKEYVSIFPDTCLNASNVRTVSGGYMRNSDIFEVVGHSGVYRSAGVGGGITGMGGEWVLVDDPIKNQEEANSLTYRQKVWDWYRSTLYTRLAGKDASILIMLTRWHEDDLAGRLLRLAEEDLNADQWEILKLEAVKETDPNDTDPREIGEALWPDRFPLEMLVKNKANGAYVWNALFQQRPAPPEGGIIKRKWLRHYNDLPDGVTDWLMSWDMNFKATKRGSFVAGQLWCRKDANFYLVDQVHGRLEFADTLREFIRMHQKYQQCRTFLVEEAANGAAVMSMLRGKIAGIIPVTVRGSKEARLQAVSPVIESGNVYLPREVWAEELEEELVTFPHAPANDQVDALSQALDRYMSKGSVKPIRLNLDMGLRLGSEMFGG